MVIDLSRIPEKGIEINQDFSFDEDFISKTSIQELNDVHVEGKIYYDVTREIKISLTVDGKMVLLDAIDLQPIDYPFHIDILEVLRENDQYLEDNSLNLENSLDIMNFLWENIVLEVPIRVVKDENKHVSLQGEGWELIDENTKKVDPRLAPLAALLENEGKE